MDALTPTLIDLASWPRREHFAYYREAVPCSWSLTVEVDATAFVAAHKESGRKTYVAQIWALATIVNRHAEFRMALLPDGAPATWPVLHPSFTVFNTERETFSVLWAEYEADFGAFHETMAGMLQRYRAATAMFPQGEPPANVFDVSSLPRTTFGSLHIQTPGVVDHLLPIFTLGRYVEREGRTMLPLAVQVNHAAVDGFHVSRFVAELEQLLADPSWLANPSLPR